MTTIPWSAAYHEAGHAVARIYVGSPATDTRVFEDGTGYSEGTLEAWKTTNPGVGAVWDLILVLMAGMHAEAKATKRSLATLQYSHGLKDFVLATGLVMWLARGGGKRAEDRIWCQVQRERRFFLRNCWSTIDSTAVLLQEKGFVSRRELQALTRGYRRHRVTAFMRPPIDLQSSPRISRRIASAHRRHETYSDDR